MAEAETGGRRPVKSRGTGLGGTLILMVFVVVCLAVFSALSFVTARADLALSRKNTIAIEKFYTADTAAQKKLIQIDKTLIQAAGMDGSFRSNAGRLLTKLPDLVYQAGNTTTPDRVAFEIKIDETRSLYVELALDAEGSDKRYTISDYKTINNSDWETASRIEVWNQD